MTWRTGFPFDIPARLPRRNDPTYPGTSGAGDPFLSNAALVAPVRYLDPRKNTTINVINYGSDASGNCLITSTPVTGNFYFDPNSFTNVGLANDGSSGSVNPCFPFFDPINNPSQRTYGAPRNYLRGPHQANFDLAIAKTTAITERVNLEFRVEYFNVLNHPEFAQPTKTNGNNNIDSATFGQITSTGSFRGAAQRIGQLAARLTF